MLTAVPGTGCSSYQPKDQDGKGIYQGEHLCAEIPQCQDTTLPDDFFRDFMNGGQHTADAAGYSLIGHRAVGDRKMGLLLSVPIFVTFSLSAGVLTFEGGPCPNSSPDVLP